MYNKLTIRKFDDFMSDLSAKANFLIRRTETKTQIQWSYSTISIRNHLLWVIKSKYSKEEIDLIDELFKNLDSSNLIIIKKIIASKYKLKE